MARYSTHIVSSTGDTGSTGDSPDGRKQYVQTIVVQIADTIVNLDKPSGPVHIGDTIHVGPTIHIGDG